MASGKSGEEKGKLVNKEKGTNSTSQAWYKVSLVIFTVKIPCFFEDSSNKIGSNYRDYVISVLKLLMNRTSKVRS
jgi:hypothetical protein